MAQVETDGDTRSVNFIRKSTRELLESRRRHNREDLNDNRRAIANITVTQEWVQEICNKLKTKVPVSVDELRTLKNALQDDLRHIKTVLATHGALRGIVRELSGHDVRKQCEAAGCCCNLALGDSRGSNIIAKATGSYLVTCLDSLSTELAVTCAWVLGNLAGSGTRVCDVLIAQGVLAKLTYLLETSASDDVVQACGYALTHFVYQMRDDLSSDHLEKLTQALSKTSVKNLPPRLNFLVTCHSDFNVSEQFLQTALHSFTHYANEVNQSESVLYCVRTLANCCVENAPSDFVIRFLLDNNLCETLRMFSRLNENVLSLSVMWFLGNLLKFATDGSDKDKFLENMCC